MNLNNAFTYGRLQRWLPACAAVAITLLAVSTASACPSCKVALASQGQGDLVSGFFYSILFMLSMPFAILGSFSGYMYLLVRRARRYSEHLRRTENHLAESSSLNDSQ